MFKLILCLMFIVGSSLVSVGIDGITQLKMSGSISAKIIHEVIARLIGIGILYILA